MIKATVRIRCAGCDYSGALVNFLNIGASPPANTPNVTKRFPLRVMVCTNCWLTQLRDVLPDDVLFSNSYTFYSRTSPALVEYHTQLADQLCKRYPEHISGFIVEIGSNDGSLLQVISEQSGNTNILGVDPASGPAESALQHGVYTHRKPFNLSTARDIKLHYQSASLIIGKNVIAHVADINDLLAGVAELLSPNGLAVFEVQYLGNLLVANQFDQVYHEHRYFYSLTGLTHLADRHGLTAVDVEFTEPQGGSIRVTFAKNVTYEGSPVQDVLTRERWLRDTASYLALQPRVELIRDHLRKLLEDEYTAGRVVAGYGAPAKATTLLNFCGVDVTRVRYVTDTTIAKQGTCVPGTNIPIVAPNWSAKKPDTYLALAWNYAPQIIRREATFLACGGKLILPLPAPIVI